MRFRTLDCFRDTGRQQELGFPLFFCGSHFLSFSKKLPAKFSFLWLLRSSNFPNRLNLEYFDKFNHAGHIEHLDCFDHFAHNHINDFTAYPKPNLPSNLWQHYSMATLKLVMSISSHTPRICSRKSSRSPTPTTSHQSKK